MVFYPCCYSYHTTMKAMRIGQSGQVLAVRHIASHADRRSRIAYAGDGKRIETTHGSAHDLKRLCIDVPLLFALDSDENPARETSEPLTGALDPALTDADLEWTGIFHYAHLAT